MVRFRDIAALVSDVSVSRPLGTPEDLLVHEDLLDASAASAPVLPVRFGAVVTGEDVVASELLEPHYDEFSAALGQLEGCAEFIVRGRYDQATVLPEILQEDPRIAELAAAAQAADPAASRDMHVRLGESISERIADKRAHDTQVVADALAQEARASVSRPAADDFEAVHAAFLVETSAADGFMSAADRIAADWEGRVEIRVIGPVAAYDFVGTSLDEDPGQGG
jgi:hypothetical protein